MSLYKVTFDGEDAFVEAPCFTDAIVTWRNFLLAEWRRTGDFSPEDVSVEPESVVLVTNEPVQRFAWLTLKQGAE